MPEIRFGGLASGPASPARHGADPAFTVREAPDGLVVEFDAEGKSPTDINSGVLRALQSMPGIGGRFGDPERGATLEQAWHTNYAFVHVEFVCLLAAGRPEVPTDAIPRTVRLDPRPLVEALAAIVGDWRAQAHLFAHDGTMGHRITLKAHDPVTGTFTFFDPWPARSLLCHENNDAGVDAQEAPDGHWTLTAAELERVAFAAFVWPRDWARVDGTPHSVALADLKASDFWSFFRMREGARGRVDGAGLADGVGLVEILPGAFREHVSLAVALEDGLVREAWFAFRRAWLGGREEGWNPLPLDLAASFLGAVCPPADRPQMDALRGGLRALRGGSRDGLAPAAVDLAATWAGARPSSRALLRCSLLRTLNEEQEDGPWLVGRYEVH